MWRAACARRGSLQVVEAQRDGLVVGPVQPMTTGDDEQRKPIPVRITREDDAGVTHAVEFDLNEALDFIGALARRFDAAVREKLIEATQRQKHKAGKVKERRRRRRKELARAARDEKGTADHDDD